MINIQTIVKLYFENSNCEIFLLTKKKLTLKINQNNYETR